MDKQSQAIKKRGGHRPGAGRPKGSPNKFTAAAKDIFQKAFDDLGGVDELVKWAKENPTDFYRLYARLIPTQQQITDSEGNSLQVSVSFVSPGEDPA